MNANVSLESVVGALSLLGTALLLAVLGLVFVHALVRRKFWRAKTAFAAGLVLAAVYAAAMLSFSFASRERLIARGGEKYFCELDCHLAYSVVGVRRARSSDASASEATGGSEFTGGREFLIVTLRTRFDENTVTPTRGDFPLAPNPRSVRVFDERGRSYCISEEGGRLFGAGVPLDTPLKPGESYTTDLVFELPEGARAHALLLNESMFATRFIIGHENSPLHAKTKFRLEPLG